MNNKYSFTTHEISLISLSLLGSIPVVLTGGGTNLVQLILSLFAVLLFMPLILWLINRIFGVAQIAQVSSFAKQLGLTLVYIATAVFVLLIAWQGVVEYSKFTTIIIIPGANGIWVQFLFLIVCVWLSMTEPTSVLKIALVFFVIVFLSMLALFIFAIPHFITNFRALLASINFDSVFSLSEWKFSTALRFFLPLPAILVFFPCALEKANKKSTYVGVTISAALFGLCMLQLILMFDAQYLNTLHYPYISSVSIIAAGDVILRLDGLVYLIFFASSLLRVSACLITLRFLLAKYTKNFSRYLPPLCGALIVFLSLIN